MPRAGSYMTAAQYEAWGLIDEIEAEAMKVRHTIEQDYRGKRIAVRTHKLASLIDSLDDAVNRWEEEDEDAPTVDETIRKEQRP